MKKRLLLMGLAMYSLNLFAQLQIEKNAKDYEAIIPTKKQELVRDMDVIANMRFGLNNRFKNGDYEGSNFKNEQFRLEFRGKVHEKVSFRWRNRFTREQNPGSLDNLTTSADMAYIQVQLDKKTFFRAGKMCADWGGVEFDLNPIDIYEYNDILEYADNFLSGVHLGRKVGAESNHELGVEMLNSRTKTFQDLYPTMVDSVIISKYPGAFVFSWRGDMFNKKWQTLYSYSLFNEARNKYMNYIAIGNWFNITDKFQLNYDFKWSDEALDRKTIVTDMAKQIMGGDVQLAYYDARYVEHWIQFNYRANPKWNLSLVLMSSDAYWGNAPGKTGEFTKLRTSYGVIPSLEYYPFEDLNLRFFANYVGRFYEYSDYAKQNGVNTTLENTARYTIGFISPLLIL